jgi:hypothetical protein
MWQHKTIDYLALQMITVGDSGVLVEHRGVMLHEGVLSTAKNDRFGLCRSAKLKGTRPHITDLDR